MIICLFHRLAVIRILLLESRAFPVDVVIAS